MILLGIAEPFICLSFAQWDAEYVPVDEVAVFFRKYEKVMGEGDTRDDINRVVRSQRNHHEGLEEQDEKCEDSAKVPANGPEFEQEDVTDADVARIEEVIGLTIRRINAEEAGVVPIVTLWLLDFEDLLQASANGIEN